MKFQLEIVSLKKYSNFLKCFSVGPRLLSIDSNISVKLSIFKYQAWSYHAKSRTKSSNQNTNLKNFKFELNLSSI